MSRKNIHAMVDIHRHMIKSSFDQPKIARGSIIHFMMDTDQPSLKNFLKIIISQISFCIDDSNFDESPASINEKIHELKNALVPIGSIELLEACDQLRLESTDTINIGLLEKRYKSIAEAGLKLVKKYKFDETYEHV